MKISQLLNESSKTRQSIFESIGKNDPYFKKWEKEIHPVLCEVAMDPTQIQQLFKDIEKSAGRSALGKGVDALKGAADKVGDVWFNKFGGMLQNSAPVKNFDQKWEDIKSKVAAKNPGLASKLAKYGEFAKNNPNLHKFLLAIAGSAAAALGIAVAGGVGAGTLAVGTGTGVAVGILNIADRLLQGQKASTAIGRGVTAGAIAGLTAGAITKAKEALDQLGAVRIIKQGATANFNGHTFYMKPEEAKIFSDAVRANAQAAANVQPGGITAMMDANSARMADATAKILAKISDPAYQEAAYKMLKVGTRIEPGMIGQAANAAASALKAVQPVLSAVAGQAVGSGGEKPAPAAPVKESLNRQQINELFGITGNKIDASKLEKAWKKAGSPTDSDRIATILVKNGVPQDLMLNAFSGMGIDTHGMGIGMNGATTTPASGGPTASAAPNASATPSTSPTSTTPAAPKQNVDSIVVSIQSLLSKLKQIDPKLYPEHIKKITGGA